MNKGLILAATLVVAVLAAVGWQASSGGGDPSPPLKEAAAQTQQQTQQQARPAGPDAAPRPADDAPAAGAREDRSPEGRAPQEPAGDTQTRRLAVDNVLQVVGLGCVSCASIIAGTLQNADGVERLKYETETDTYVVTVNDDFRMDEVAKQLRSISKDYNRQIGLPDRPDWVLREA